MEQDREAIHVVEQGGRVGRLGQLIDEPQLHAVWVATDSGSSGDGRREAPEAGAWALEEVVVQEVAESGS